MVNVGEYIYHHIPYIIKCLGMEHGPQESSVGSSFYHQFPKS